MKLDDNIQARVSTDPLLLQGTYRGMSIICYENIFIWISSDIYIYLGGIHLSLVTQLTEAHRNETDCRRINYFNSMS